MYASIAAPTAMIKLGFLIAGGPCEVDTIIALMIKSFAFPSTLQILVPLGAKILVCGRLRRQGV